MSRSTNLQALLRTAALTATVCSLVLTLPGQALAQQSVQVDEKDGLLSVQASNTSASSLAEKLTDELGISVVVTGDTETLINVDIVDEPIDKALSKLSPNHMLVRSSERPDSSIVEVVLMMGESDAASSAGSDDEFLPSGSPADDIIVNDEQLQPDDSAPPEDTGPPAETILPPASELSGLPQNGNAPAPESFNPVTGMPVDPNTGQPVQ